MSSEYSLHLSDRPLAGRVVPLGEGYGTTVALISEAQEHTNRERFTLYIKDERLLEMSLLFHKIAQDLAALLPDVEACCRCVPGTPDDQCAVHGYGAYKINRAHGEGPDWRTHRHRPGDPLQSQHGPDSHTHNPAGNVDGIMGLPHPRHICPLCDEPSPNGEVHSECSCREQCAADLAAESQRQPTDTIPIDEAGEHVEPPHRWG